MRNVSLGRSLRASNESDIAGPRQSNPRRRSAELLEAFNDWCDCLKETAPGDYERLPGGPETLIVRVTPPLPPEV